MSWFLIAGTTIGATVGAASGGISGGGKGAAKGALMGGIGGAFTGGMGGLASGAFGGAAGGAGGGMFGGLLGGGGAGAGGGVTAMGSGLGGGGLGSGAIGTGMTGAEMSASALPGVTVAPAGGGFMGAMGKLATPSNMNTLTGMLGGGKQQAPAQLPPVAPVSSQPMGGGMAQMPQPPTGIVSSQNPLGSNPMEILAMMQKLRMV